MYDNYQRKNPYFVSVCENRPNIIGMSLVIDNIAKQVSQVLYSSVHNDLHSIVSSAPKEATIIKIYHPICPQDIRRIWP